MSLFSIFNLIDDENVISKREPPFADTHLQMPLTIHTLKTIYSGQTDKKYLRVAHQLLKTFEREKSLAVLLDSNQLIKDITSISKRTIGTKTLLPDTPRWEKSYKDQLDWLRRSVGATVRDHDNLFHFPEQLDFTATCYCYERELWEDVANKSCRINSKRERMVHLRKECGFYVYEVYEDIDVYIANNLSILRYQNRYHLIDHNITLMISDLISARVLTLLTTQLAENPLLYPPHWLVKKLYDWGDSVLLDFGNEGYKAIKFLEPIMQGVLMQKGKPERYVDEMKFFNQMWMDLGKLIPEQHYTSQKLREICDLLLLESNPPSWASQLFGLYRHWGHPIVNSIEGLEAIKKIGLMEKPFNATLNGLVIDEFIKMICLGFFKKKGFWPNLDLRNLSHLSEIRAAYKSQRMVNEQSLYYNSKEWRNVKGIRTFTIPEGYNLATILSDKSHSPSVRELISHLKKSSSKDRSIGYRVLNSWLETNFPDPKTILDQINENGFDDQEKLIGVRPKERELKATPRMFALLPLNIRLYFVLTEQLISTNILPLVPSTTMSDSFMELTRKMFMTSTSQGDGIKTASVVMNLDFKKWNSYMRHEMVVDCFRFLDELYGYDKVISRTHEFFEESLIYLADGSYDIQYEDEHLLEGEGAYRGHRGGLEGLRQKGWTLYTAALLHTVCNKYRVKFSIMGQGDNQVITLYFKISEFTYDNLPTQREIRRIQQVITDFSDELNDTCGQVGLVLKKDETWLSSKLFAYGKQLFLDGVPLPLGLKRICRASHMTNDQYPSLSNALATICTSSEGLCMNDVTPILALMIGGVEMRRCISLYLDDDPTQGKPYASFKPGELRFSYRSDNEMVTKRITRQTFLTLINDTTLLSTLLMSVGSAIGGLNVTIPWEFLTRGFPDPVTCQYGYLLALLKCDLSTEEQRAIENVLCPKYKEKVDYFMLFQDPVSVNIENARKEDNVMKGFVKRYLQTSPKITNQKFRNIMDLAELTTDDIVEYLSTMKPLKPRIAADLLSSTIPGYAAGIMSRFEKTRTLIGKAYDESGDDISRALKKCSRETLISFIYQVTTKNQSLSEYTCSAKLSQKIREESWKNCTIEDVTVAHPLEAFQIYDVTMGVCKKKSCRTNQVGHVLIKLEDENVRFSTHEMITKIGNNSPYLGSSTQEKTTGKKKLVIANLDPTMKKAIDVQRLIPWATSEESHVAQFIRLIMESITDLPANLFSDNSLSTSGSVGHRYQDLFTKHGGYSNNLYTPYTHIQISTNFLRKYSKGGKNYNLHFQNMLTSLQEQVVVDLLTSKSGVSSFHCHQVCECITTIPETSVDTPEGFRGRLIPQKHHEEIFIPSTKLEVKIPVQMTINKMIVPLNKLTERTLTRLVGYKIGRECYVIGQNLSKEGREMMLSHRISQIPYVWFLKTNITDIFDGFLDELLTDCVLSLHLGVDQSELKRDQIGLRVFNRIETMNPKELIALILGVSLKENLTEMQSIGYLVPPADVNISTHVMTTVVRESLYTRWSQIVDRMEDKNAVTEVLMEPNEGTVSIRTVFTGLIKRIFRDVNYTTCPYYIILRVLNNIRENWNEMTTSMRKSGYLQLHWIDFLNYPERTNVILTLSGDYGLEVVRLLNESSVIHCFEHTLDSLSKMCKKKDYILKKTESEVHRLPSMTSQVYFCKDDFRDRTEMPISINIPKKRHLLFLEPQVVKNNEVPIVHLYKPVSMMTTAVYKFLSIFNYMKFQTDATTPISIACLGDGSGGTVNLCNKYWRPENLFYNSLVGGGKWIPHMLSEMTCPAMYESGFIEKVAGLDLMADATSNFVDKDYPKVVQKYRVRNNIPDFDMVTVDAEHGSANTIGQDLLYIESVCNFCLFNLKRGGDLIYKTYLTHEESFFHVVSVLTDTFEKISIIRSQFSGHGNTELYLLCKDYTTEQVSFFKSRKECYASEKMQRVIKSLKTDLDKLSDNSLAYTKWLETPMSLQKMQMKLLSLINILGLPSKVIQFESVPELLSSAMRFSLSHNVSSILVQSRLAKTNQTIITHATIQRLWCITWTLSEICSGRMVEEQLISSALPSSGHLLVYLSVQDRIHPVCVNNREILPKIKKISDKENKTKTPSVTLYNVRPSADIIPLLKNTFQSLAAVKHMKNERFLQCEKTRLRLLFARKTVSGFLSVGSVMQPKSGALFTILKKNDIFR